jgi:hypothetical protein
MRAERTTVADVGASEDGDGLAEPKRGLSPAAERALAEARARRAQADPDRARELNGRGGLDPARYGDWEVKGIASDF